LICVSFMYANTEQSSMLTRHLNLQVALAVGRALNVNLASPIWVMLVLYLNKLIRILKKYGIYNSNPFFHIVPYFVIWLAHTCTHACMFSRTNLLSFWHICIYLCLSTMINNLMHEKKLCSLNSLSSLWRPSFKVEILSSL
jgi:hypothetical protein